MPLNPNIRKIDSDVFTGLVDQGNPYAGKAWADAFGAIGDAVQDITEAGTAKRQRDKEEAERERLLSLQEWKEANQTFNIEAAATDGPQIRNAKQDASVDLANEAADLSRRYRRGEITMDDYKKQEAELTRSLQAVQNGDAFLNSTALAFNTMVNTPDSVSNASSNEALAVAKGIANGNVTMGWNSETNRLEYAGTYVDAEGNEQPIAGIEVGKENAFPRLVEKAPDPKADLLNLNIQINKTLRDTSTKNGIEYTGTSWTDPQVQASYDAAITTMVSDTDKALSYATDHLGISRDEAYALMQQGVEGGGNALQQRVKNDLMAQAEAQFFGNEQSRISAEATLARQHQQD